MAPAPPDNYNGRVTNARLSAQLEALTKEIQRYTERTDRRITFLEEKIALDVGEVRTHCQENETNIARLEERQKSWTGILGALTIVGSAVGSLFGFVK
jgi:chromosome segregation ATPase